MLRTVAVCLVAVSVLLAARAFDTSAQPVVPVVIPGKFDTATEHILIPVTIGGRKFWCNPDTGVSTLIALDQAKAVAAGLRVAPGIPTPDGNPPSAGDSSTTATVVVGGVEFVTIRSSCGTCRKRRPTWTASWGWRFSAASWSSSNT